MQTIACPNAASTRLVQAGNFDFCHIYNGTGATLFICYDGDSGNSDATKMANHATPFLDKTWVMLNNDGVKPIFRHDVWILNNSGADVSLQVQGIGQST